MNKPDKLYSKVTSSRKGKRGRKREDEAEQYNK